MNKAANNQEQLGKAPIGKLLLRYSIPAIIAMVINAIYNIVDRIFIGQFVGEEALAALTIAFPLMMVSFAVATLIGQGSASLISIRLGEKNKEGADHVFSNGLVLTLVFGAVVIACGIIFMDPLLSIMGAEGPVKDLAADYMQVIFAGFIFQMLGFYFSNIARSDGSPILAMSSMAVSGLSNMVLDYIFIAILGWGVQGAALATIMGQALGFFILLRHFAAGKSSLRMHGKDLVPDPKVVGRIMAVGSATFVTTLGTSISAALLNRSLGEYGGTAAITSMGAINSLYTLVIMPIMGMQGGIQPIIGYNHGAGQGKRSREALVKAIAMGVGFSLLVFTLLQLFPTTLIGMFLAKDSSTMDVAVNGLRIFFALLPIVSIHIFGTAYFQAVADSRKALFVGALRQFLYLVPVVMILPGFFGLNGVWAATPVADGLAVITTILMLIHAFRSKARKETGVELLQAASA